MLNIDEAACDASAIVHKGCSFVVKSRMFDDDIRFAQVEEQQTLNDSLRECTVLLLPHQLPNEGVKMAFLRKLLDEEAHCVDPNGGRRIWRLRVDASTVLTKLVQLGFIISAAFAAETVYTWTLVGVDDAKHTEETCRAKHACDAAVSNQENDSCMEFREIRIYPQPQSSQLPTRNVPDGQPFKRMCVLPLSAPSVNMRSRSDSSPSQSETLPADVDERRPQSAVRSVDENFNNDDGEGTDFAADQDDDSPPTLMEAAGGASKETANHCVVCGGNPADQHYYGALVCEECRLFFRRSVQGGLIYTCRKGRHVITALEATKCQYCWFQQCIRNGMCKEEAANDVDAGLSPVTNAEKADENISIKSAADYSAACNAASDDADSDVVFSKVPLLPPSKKRMKSRLLHKKLKQRRMRFRQQISVPLPVSGDADAGNVGENASPLSPTTPATFEEQRNRMWACIDAVASNIACPELLLPEQEAERRKSKAERKVLQQKQRKLAKLAALPQQQSSAVQSHKKKKLPVPPKRAKSDLRKNKKKAPIEVDPLVEMTTPNYITYKDDSIVLGEPPFERAIDFNDFGSIRERDLYTSRFVGRLKDFLRRMLLASVPPDEAVRYTAPIDNEKLPESDKEFELIPEPFKIAVQNLLYEGWHEVSVSHKDNVAPIQATPPTVRYVRMQIRNYFDWSRKYAANAGKRALIRKIDNQRTSARRTMREREQRRLRQLTAATLNGEFDAEPTDAALEENTGTEKRGRLRRRKSSRAQSSSDEEEAEAMYMSSSDVEMQLDDDDEE